MTARVAPSAVVEEGAELGDGTVVWDLAQIRGGAVVGRECVIGRNVFIDAGATVGNRCKIQNNALVYAPVVLQDGVFIGPGVVITNDRQPRAVSPDLELKRAGDWVPGAVVIEQGAALGAGSIIVTGTRVGKWAMVAAGAVVTSDVPPYSLVVGVPARHVAWVGPAGERLEGSGDEWRCPVSGTRYQLVDGLLEERA